MPKEEAVDLNSAQASESFAEQTEEQKAFERQEEEYIEQEAGYDESYKAEGETPECEFVTGIAGSGKTWEMKARIAQNPKYAIMAATTGIAAINLDTTTINSVLKYFDTESLEERYQKGELTRIMSFLKTKRIVIDEVSMMDGRQLDYIYRAASECHPKIGLVLTGDFCQLPPVNVNTNPRTVTWAFEADCWGEFESATTRLTKCWRQTDPRYLEALNLIRSGYGYEGVERLKSLVHFERMSDIRFRGTTILAKNIDVDRYNFVALQRQKGADIKVVSKRWGKAKGEWKNIPEILHVREGAYVMILTNDQDFVYVNGDCGYIRSYDPQMRTFQVELVRNQQLVWINEITRNNEQREKPPIVWDETEPRPRQEEWEDEGAWNADNNARRYRSEAQGPWWGAYYTPSGKISRKRWILGQVRYFPLRLAWASTVHKSQGLSLDGVQMDINNHFYSQPAMIYVALSRCKSPEGLRIVGMPQTMAKRVSTDPKVARWL